MLTFNTQVNTASSPSHIVTLSSSGSLITVIKIIAQNTDTEPTVHSSTIQHTSIASYQPLSAFSSDIRHACWFLETAFVHKVSMCVCVCLSLRVLKLLV